MIAEAGGHTRSAARTRSGVNGTSRSRAPVASKMAFAMAGGIGDVAASPAPTDGSSRRSINSMSIAPRTASTRQSSMRNL